MMMTNLFKSLLILLALQLTGCFHSSSDDEPILTFGGDREVFFQVDGVENYLRVENDVWRYSSPE
ncbi:hypothetical protein LNL84_07715 [Vibrio sp. ZSDZ34]|uniref:Uncharacterized protein n=1 Tax=Vibrio gelatinilyticus TaxID=2893468 RepID=A0A9X2AYJ5_9VIBR|nr:hypothetical protein [Vibrio gelatinilyticus]MCJ2376723.1 hypothetical protein [Vibrio gelatinilyticus]